MDTQKRIYFHQRIKEEELASNKPYSGLRKYRGSTHNNAKFTRLTQRRLEYPEPAHFLQSINPAEKKIDS